MVEQFCRSILQIVGKNTKALANLVMGLASQSSAKSVVELSLSPVYHYQYSSISKSIKNLDQIRSKDKGSKTGKEAGSMSRPEVGKKFTN